MHCPVNLLKMREMDTETQERLRLVVGAKVTRSEKEAIETVAGVRGTTVSNLLRTMSIKDILAERRRLEREHGLAVAAA